MAELQDSYSILIVSVVPLRLPSNSIANITPTNFIKTNIKVITYFVAETGKKRRSIPDESQTLHPSALARNAVMLKMPSVAKSTWLRWILMFWLHNRCVAVCAEAEMLLWGNCL